MRRARLLTAFTAFSLLVLTAAPSAFAGVRDHGGQGWFGQSTDPAVTDMMFITIAFFPTIIIIFSLIQWFLDKRKHARYDAEKARAASADWRGGGSWTSASTLATTPRRPARPPPTGAAAGSRLAGASLRLTGSRGRGSQSDLEDLQQAGLGLGVDVGDHLDVVLET